jgi:hypothetical protein
MDRQRDELLGERRMHRLSIGCGITGSSICRAAGT